MSAAHAFSFMAALKSRHDGRFLAETNLDSVAPEDRVSLSITLYRPDNFMSVLVGPKDDGPFLRGRVRVVDGPVESLASRRFSRLEFEREY